MIDYPKRFVEVEEILNHLWIEEYKKIPIEILNFISNNKDKDYIWEYDNTKKLKDQNVNDDSIAILSYINMEYLLNEKQKQYMEEVHKINDKKIYVEYKKEMFSKKEINYSKNEIQDIKLVKPKYDFIKKIINFFKKFFK